MMGGGGRGGGRGEGRGGEGIAEDGHGHIQGEELGAGAPG